MPKVFFKIFILLIVIVSAASINYCLPKLCKGNIKHIGCNHTANFASNCPADSKLVRINYKLRNLIVGFHNEKRNYVAGGAGLAAIKACNMPTMQWDDELAHLAGLNVLQCNMQHDDCHNTEDFEYSGQNLAFVLHYTRQTSVTIFKHVLNLWYNEVVNFDMDYLRAFPTNYNGPPMSHYTVMISDRNTHVGCAAATYTVSNDMMHRNYTGYLVACNYATNNMIGEPIFSTCSKAASKCYSGTNCMYPNLCSINEQYNVNKF